MSVYRNPGDAMKEALALKRTNVVSDTTADADDQFGAVIDRTVLGRHYTAVTALLSVDAATASTAGAKKQVDVYAWVQDAAASSGAWTAFTSSGHKTTFQALGATATSTEFFGAVRVAADLTRARRYLRLATAVDVAATSSNVTDVNIAGVFAFAAGDENPATTSNVAVL